MEILIHTDAARDNCYLAFSDQVQIDGAIASTVAVTENISMDFDRAGKLVGMEIHNASSALASDLRAIKIGPLVGVKEAAKMAGMHRPNFIRDVAGHPDFPAPVSVLSMGRIWLESQVAEYLAGRIRRSHWRLRLD